jgi:DNA-directed RNA polymerase specialized sigma24 family protein
MARDAVIEARLQRWAEAVTVGNGSGYPVTNVLHQSWSPPSPGVTPSMKVSAMHIDARATGAAVARLKPKLQAVVRMHYVKRWPLAAMAAALKCAESTVVARLDAAHQALHADLLGGKFCMKLQPGYI